MVQPIHVRLAGDSIGVSYLFRDTKNLNAVLLLNLNASFVTLVLNTNTVYKDIIKFMFPYKKRLIQ